MSSPFLMRCAFLPCLVFLTHSSSGQAATIWDHAKNPTSVAEERVLRSLHRTLAGTGDALDQMTSRTAFVDLARGQSFQEPAISVLLLRLRRQLGLEPDRRSLRLLARALLRDQPSSIRALAALERGHILLEWDRPAEAEVALSSALSDAWLPEVRSEVLLLRGWLRLRTQRLQEAEGDFLEILGLDVGRRRLALVLMSLACVQESLGDLDRARAFLARGQAVESARAQASGASLFVGEGLHGDAVERLSGLQERLGAAPPRPAGAVP